MTVKKSTQIIELIGPAGAGKTTLLRALLNQGENFYLGKELEVRNKENYLPFIKNLPHLFPWFFRRDRSNRWFNWNEIKAMVYLYAWPDVLNRQVNKDSSTIILDHGAVFKLATLIEFGPDWLKCQGVEPLWNNIFEKWANTLNMLIWLDAPDPILAERINKRGQPHIVKDKPDREVSHFLDRYRISLFQVMDRLTSYPGPKLLHFDTFQTSANEIFANVLMACKSKQSENKKISI